MTNFNYSGILLHVCLFVQMFWHLGHMFGSILQIFRSNTHFHFGFCAFHSFNQLYLCLFFLFIVECFYLFDWTLYYFIFYVIRLLDLAKWPTVHLNETLCVRYNYWNSNKCDQSHMKIAPINWIFMWIYGTNARRYHVSAIKYFGITIAIAIVASN